MGLSMAAKEEHCGAECLHTGESRTLTESGGSAEELPENAVSAWSPCTCYFQCIPGVRTREVTCPDATQCADPEPSSFQACDCEHCADCQIDFQLFILEMILFAQAGVTLLC